MGEVRRKYSEEFKRKAMEDNSLTSDKTNMQVAQDLGVSYINIRSWRAKLTPIEEENKG